MQASTPQSSAPRADEQSVWRQHYATGAGFRHWPCEELVRAVGGRRFEGTVLEVGCGNGANLWFLAEHARRVVGVDADRTAVAEANGYAVLARGAGNVSVRRADIRALPFADGSVDAVVDVMVSQHVGWLEHEALYREYRRVLRHSGWLFLYHLSEGTTVVDESMDEEQPFTWGCVPMFPQVTPFCLPPAWALADALRRAGFAISDDVGVRGMTRSYQAGCEAHYTVIEGEAA